MIRFVDIGRQINCNPDGPRQFAIWDTIVDRFVTLNGEQVWDSFEEFKYDAEVALSYNEPVPRDVINRVKGLCPEWALKEVKDDNSNKTG